MCELGFSYALAIMARSRSSTIALSRLLHNSQVPLYLLDASRTIVFVNQCCEKWLGVPSDEIVGAQADYHHQSTESDAKSIANALCPPPETFTGVQMQGTISCFLGEQRNVTRRAMFLPLGGEEDCAGVLVVVSGDETDESGGSALELDPAELHTRLATIQASLARTFSIDQLIGESDAIVKVREQVRLASLSDANVIISGPSGSGREHVARTIHYQRHPTGGWLVPLDCALQTPESIQQSVTTLLRDYSELAPEALPALLLLDVDQLPIPAQHELLGFLDLPGVSLRVLSTTELPNQQLTSSDLLQQLGHKLDTLSIQIPPLAERTEDVPLLCQHFLEELNTDGGPQWSGFTTAAMEELVSYPWRGNLDEVRSMVREACQAAKSGFVQLTDLPNKIQFARQIDARVKTEQQPINLDEYLASVEQELIRRAINAAKGNKTKAAELLGVTRARLHRRLQQSDTEETAE